MTNPLRWAIALADRFEARGVYVPGEDGTSPRQRRRIGWLVAGWLCATGLLVAVFLVAG